MIPVRRLCFTRSSDSPQKYNDYFEVPINLDVILFIVHGLVQAEGFFNIDLSKIIMAIIIHSFEEDSSSWFKFGCIDITEWHLNNKMVIYLESVIYSSWFTFSGYVIITLVLCEMRQDCDKAIHGSGLADVNIIFSNVSIARDCPISKLMLFIRRMIRYVICSSLCHLLSLATTSPNLTFNIPNI
ncbi:hypothetical protein LOAG_08586 [Loa loa]|uniref:Uncharacterized protein n=1 Tax=Loa loa TaxID=7209 RepID=A0A1S0TTB3_LOALO|nr:hypothetical protein LOAG_08586 [Loa loa]EFO19903.1 hypothetical protein LOAG_08586 [Loa loa]